MLQKLKEEGDLGFPASTELRQAWDEVLDNYEDETIHKDFLALCQQEDNLVYASRQYGRLITAHGGDETAQKMRDQVLALSQVALDSSPKKPEEPTVRYWSFSSFILFFSAALIGVGFFLEPWRNMVGVGVAIIFFTLAFRNYRGK